MMGLWKDAEPHRYPDAECKCGCKLLTHICTIVSCNIVGEERVVGARYSCQRCPEIFSVGPNGRFDHHPRSLPWSPQVPVQAVRSDPDPVERESRPFRPSFELPVARERPAP